MSGEGLLPSGFYVARIGSGELHRAKTGLPMYFETLAEAMRELSRLETAETAQWEVIYKATDWREVNTG